MEKKEDTQQPAEVEPRIEEEEKKGAETVPVTEEGKKSSIRDNLMQLINQLDNRQGTSAAERRQIEMIKQMVPLYEKHDFWDTQPVPNTTNVSTTVMRITHIVGERPRGWTHSEARFEERQDGTIPIASWF
jgi:hypothetical protein